MLGERSCWRARRDCNDARDVASLLLRGRAEYAHAQSSVPPTINSHPREIAMADNTVRGRFVWHELMTPDTSGAHAFYSKAVGWKTQPWEHDPSYQMFAAGSGPLGGSVAQVSGTPHWLHYIGTPDIDATVATAKSR